MAKSSDEFSVRAAFNEFEPLSTGSHEEKVLHALEYIAEAVGVLAKAQFDPQGVGRGGQD